MIRVAITRVGHTFKVIGPNLLGLAGLLGSSEDTVDHTLASEK